MSTKRLICEKHRNYKGINKPTNNCQTCSAFFNKVNDAIYKKGPYKSITTPGKRCYLEHLLTELMCVMLFGPQCPYFWRKASAASDKVKAYYKITYNAVRKWTSTQGQATILLSGLLNQSYIVYDRRKICEELLNAEVVSEDSKDDNLQIASDVLFQHDESVKKSKWESLSGD